MVTVSKNLSTTFLNPNALLLICLVVMVFFIPVLPVHYHRFAYNFLFSCIFILSALSLQHSRKRVVIAFALFLIVIVWVASKVDLTFLFLVSRIGQGLFFILIVIGLIKQTANAKNVNVSVMADSINGYLLVGVVYFMVVYSIVRFQPDAFHFSAESDSDERGVMSKMFYYTFVTYTSTGYGDITPILPGPRSFATLIAVTGQLYIAIIVALLVGKFSRSETAN
jgi:voltage-gated potassium channel